MTAFDDLALLRAFVAIAEAGSISAAARRLKIPQPTLSRYLRDLEERCGASLILRDTHRMSLTQAGHSLLADAEILIAHAEEAQQRMHDGQTTITGHLRLFSTIDSGQFIVSRLVSSFLQINPKVTAELAFTNRPMRMIEEGCDVGILAGKIVDDSVVARSAGHITLGLAASPSLVKSRPPVKTLADLRGWPWINLSGFQFWNPREVTLHRPDGALQSLAISPVLLSEGVTSIREAARAGLGIAVLPDWLIREDLDSGRLIRILPKWKCPDLPMHVVHASHRLLPRRVRAFVEFAVTYLAKALG